MPSLKKQEAKLLVLQLLLVLVIDCLSFQQNETKLVNLLLKVSNGRDFRTLVVYEYANKAENCISGTDLEQLNIPTILLTAAAENISEVRELNSAILVLCCLQESYAEDYFLGLLEHLGKLRSSHIIFYWNVDYAEAHATQLAHLFHSCQRYYMLHVISLFQDYAVSKQFYSYTQFPSFMLKQQPLHEIGFPDRLLDLKGAALRVLPSMMEPASIIYRDKQSQKLHIAGYTTRILHAFAEKINATLVYPLPITLPYTYDFNELFDMIWNGTLDTVVGLFNPNGFRNPPDCSVIVEQSVWSIMVPLTAPVPVYQLYALIFKSTFMLINALLLFSFSLLLSFEHYHWHQPHVRRSFLHLLLLTSTTKVLRGMLGQVVHTRISQSFVRRLIFIFLFLTGIFVSTTFIAYLQSYLTRPPKASEINSFRALQTSPIRLSITPVAYDVVVNYTGLEFWQQFKDIFAVTEDANLYNSQRASLDTQYAYSVSSTTWQLLQQTQAYLPQPLFHLPEEMYITKSLYLSFPLYKHSIYRAALNDFIMQMHKSGLFYKWVSMSYADMVAAGRIGQRNFEQREKSVGALGLADFYWVWWLYGWGIAVAMFGFIVEIIAFECVKISGKIVRTI